MNWSLAFLVPLNWYSCIYRSIGHRNCTTRTHTNAYIHTDFLCRRRRQPYDVRAWIWVCKMSPFDFKLIHMHDFRLGNKKVSRRFLSQYKQLSKKTNCRWVLETNYIIEEKIKLNFSTFSASNGDLLFIYLSEIA